MGIHRRRFLRRTFLHAAPFRFRRHPQPLRGRFGGFVCQRAVVRHQNRLRFRRLPLPDRAVRTGYTENRRLYPTPPAYRRNRPFPDRLCRRAGQLVLLQRLRPSI